MKTNWFHPFFALAATAVSATAGDLVAIKVGQAETITHGTLRHAVILVEDGKIATIGEDLPIERGIPVLDRRDWVVMPGLVHPYSRIGMGARGSSDFNPDVMAADELFARFDGYDDVLEAGCTTLGIYPAGFGGVPGQAVAIKTQSDGDQAKWVLDRDAYLLMLYRSDARTKKMLKDAFAKVDEYDDKAKKAREKWDKEQEKTKKKDDKKEEKKDEEKKSYDGEDEGAAQDKKDEKKDESKTFVPPTPDDKVGPFLALRDKQLRALVQITQSADWLHFQDAIDGREFEYDLRIPLTREIDVYEVKQAIGEKKLRVLMEPEITLVQGTLRQRNLPAEFADAGARIVLLPRQDSTFGVESWLRSVGDSVSAGLDRKQALRAVTLEPAEVLGLGERIGSLDKGKDANLVFFNGDPLAPGTKVQAVMLEGEWVFERGAE